MKWLVLFLLAVFTSELHVLVDKYFDEELYFPMLLAIAFICAAYVAFYWVAHV